MKVRPSVGKMCDNCQIIKRAGRVIVRCKSNPKHKQTQPIQKKKIAKF